MTNAELNEHVLRAARGSLGPGEMAQFRALMEKNPEARARYEEEMALESALSDLPNAPVSSNFTALVMQAVSREDRKESRAEPRAQWLPRWRWASAFAGVGAVALAGLFLIGRHQQAQELRAAQGATAMATMAQAIAAEETPPVEIFENFDAIQSLAHVPPETELDLELLVALQK